MAFSFKKLDLKENLAYPLKFLTWTWVMWSREKKFQTYVGKDDKTPIQISISKEI